MANLSPAELTASLESFVAFAQGLEGDEKGEAPIYLNALFRAFGHEGTKQAGATHEHRVPKGAGHHGQKFADLLWPERVLVEMKSRGQKLERHYDQIFDYWTHIVPHRPPYAILCNFDEFWIYDFNEQLFDPVDKIALADLPKRASAFAFLLPRAGKPLFDNNRVEVTRKAAAQLAKLFRSLIEGGKHDRAKAQRYVLQLLVGLVSEDMDLLPDQLLTRLIRECHDDREKSSYD
ncbi:MAG: class I SAM-dependent DNA methyltransferase, partial [Verrucomicrobiae bacterium]|nr:class I SAM-dependent DNA methyltransferase [Verrucomicrobiae bacterium]